MTTLATAVLTAGPRALFVIASWMFDTIVGMLDPPDVPIEPIAGSCPVASTYCSSGRLYSSARPIRCPNSCGASPLRLSLTYQFAASLRGFGFVGVGVPTRILCPPPVTTGLNSMSNERAPPSSTALNPFHTSLMS